MLSTLLQTGVNFTSTMNFEPYDQLVTSLITALSPPQQALIFLLASDWREVLIFGVKIGVVLTVGLIGWLYHWQEVDGGDLLDSKTEAPVQNGILDYKLHGSECGICFEGVETWKMYKNKICLHSFCYDCTTKHIEAKIQANVVNIFCPEVNCKTLLDFNSCRKIIPKSVLDKWDEHLCKSLIPVSQRVYCPFRDCLAMLVNDSGQTFMQVKCPACRRSFCATCQVPWHPGFGCKEFQSLNSRRGMRGEQFVNELAKRNHWRKCPNCKVFVEKTEGCMHITCRCKFEFCYRCGEKWSQHNRSCQLGF